MTPDSDATDRSSETKALPGSFATWRSLLPERDRWHKLRLYEVRCSLSRTSALEVRYRLAGFNASDEPSPYLPVTVAGDSPAEVEALNATMVNRLAREPAARLLDRRSVAFDGPYVKTFHAPFPQPLDPGDGFDIEIKLCWPGAAALAEDYIVADFSRWPLGVDKGAIEIVFDSEPESWWVGIVRREQTGGERLHLLPGADTALQEDGGRCVLRWMVENPSQDDPYVLGFRRELPLSITVRHSGVLGSVLARLLRKPELFDSGLARAIGFIADVGGAVSVGFFLGRVAGVW